MIKSLHYQGFEAGPTLVVLGAVHGNEPCGRYAIETIVKALEQEQLVIQKGRLLMVPVCNPKAFEQQVRFIDRNLNRHLYPKPQPVAYEDKIDPILCGILDHADVLLDLHSYASPGGPFIFLGDLTEAEQAYAFSLGISDFVFGWAQAFASGPDDKQGRFASIGTTEYVRERGGLSVTLECGQHQNSDNVEVGVKAIVLALQHLGLATGPMLESIAPMVPADRRVVQMKDVFYREKQGHFVQPWRHFDEVKAGQVLVQWEEGGEIRAPYDGVVVLPKAEVTIGSEWFYLGVLTDV